MNTRAGKKYSVLFAILAALLLPAGFAWGADAATPPVAPSAAASAGEATAPAPAPAPAPKSWRQLTDEGYRKLAAGDQAASLAAFEAALQLNPRGAAAKTGKGAVLARQGKLQEAEQILRDALVLNPDPARAHYELGRIYQQQGNYQRAAEEFKEGIAKYRENHP
jgi:tetratricopeptide (TPR) repeat protein